MKYVKIISYTLHNYHKFSDYLAIAKVPLTIHKYHLNYVVSKSKLIQENIINKQVIQQQRDSPFENWKKITSFKFDTFSTWITNWKFVLVCIVFRTTYSID